MKKTLKIIFIIIVIGAIGAYIYWQYNKKRIIRDQIESKVRDKSDSLYYIHYDSSKIDEINGDASFYNVTLQSDSAQRKLLTSADSLPNALYFINIAEVKAIGVDVAGIVQNTNVAATKILLNKPKIQIVNTGVDHEKPFTAQDTLELYQKILGKFSSIKADTIQIVNGSLIITDRKGKPLTTLENINVNLKTFLVDKDHNYSNVISYFIKDVSFSIDNIQLPETKNKTRLNITKLAYDAGKKTLQIKEMQQYTTDNTLATTNLKNINITDLNTDAFIMNQQLKAGMITCDGGLITLYKRKTADQQQKTKDVGLSTDFVDAAQIAGLKLGNTKIIIVNTLEPSSDPLVLNDVKFDMSRSLKVYDGSTISDIIANADWKLTSSGFSFVAKNKMYRMVVNGIEIDNVNGGISVNKMMVQPILSETDFFKKAVHQMDRYDFVFNNVKLAGVNYKLLFADNVLEAQSGSMQPILHIMNDRTVPPDPASKVGKYPNQLVMNMDQKIFIRSLKISNGLVAYKEKGAISEMTGVVNFGNINGEISNITNMPEHISSNNIMKLTAKTKFMGQGDLNTTWLLPLVKGNSTFNVSATIGAMDATALNPMMEPLGLASIKKGRIIKMDFSLKGDDYKAAGDVAFSYSGLKLELLKKGTGDELKKKGVVSFLANFLIKNDNPLDKTTRVSFENNRDVTKSFFNLLWKSVFVGLKKTAVGKKN